jgi:hypothetical protein
MNVPQLSRHAATKRRLRHGRTGIEKDLRNGQQQHHNENASTTLRHHDRIQVLPGAGG